MEKRYKFPEAKSLTIIPAEPGWVLVGPIIGEDGKQVVDLWEERIIAWRIEIFAKDDNSLYENTEPICVEYIGRPDDYIFKDPAGEMFVREDCGIRDREAAMRWFEEDAEKKKKWAT